MKIEDLKNKKIAILGFGEEGQSVARFLEKKGAKFFLFYVKNKNQF